MIADGVGAMVTERKPPGGGALPTFSGGEKGNRLPRGALEAHSVAGSERGAHLVDELPSA